MRICRFDNDRLGLVKGEEVLDVTPALEVIPQQRWPIALGDPLIASLDRPFRFVVDAAYATHPLFKWLMDIMRVLPISSSGGPRIILRALAPWMSPKETSWCAR